MNRRDFFRSVIFGSAAATIAPSVAAAVSTVCPFPPYKSESCRYAGQFIDVRCAETIRDLQAVRYGFSAMERRTTPGGAYWT